MYFASTSARLRSCPVISTAWSSQPLRAECERAGRHAPVSLTGFGIGTARIPTERHSSIDVTRHDPEACSSRGSCISVLYRPVRCCPPTGPTSRTNRCSTSGWPICPLAIEGTLAERIAQLQDELAARGLRVAPLLPVGRVVHARRRPRRSPSPSIWPTRASRSSRKPQMLEVEGGEHEWCMRILRHEAGHAIDNAFRLRLRRQRRAGLRVARRAVPGVLHAEAVQQELRAAPRLLVRAEPSRRGLRGDVRRLADAEQRVAAALRRLAGAQEARVHGRADALAARPVAAHPERRRGRSAAQAPQDAARSTTATSAGTTASTTRTSTIATCAACSRTRPSSRRT